VRRGFVAAGAIALLAAGCVVRPAVDRAYGGSVVRGQFVEPEAYAAFLRGAMAQAAGDLRGALSAYGEAARLDSNSPEIWTRTGEVRCKLDPRDAAAQKDFARALDLDATYARAWDAQARCATARGDAAEARAAAEKAAALDPSADGANVFLLRASGGAADAQAHARERLVALTATAGDPLIAWDALAAWAEGRGDVPLWSRALREIVRVAPERRGRVAAAAEQLAGVGALGEARAVAASAIDADDRPLEAHPLAARLALDDAIARGDLAAARRRATRARVPLEEAAGRALLAGAPAMARSLSVTAAGDGTALGARLVLAAIDGTNVVQAASTARADDAPVSAAALVAFGQALARAASAEQARAALSAMRVSAIVPGDDRVVRAAVDLVARGALSPAVLPADGTIELAVRHGDSPPEPLPSLDPRHELLALAVLRPDGARARELTERLAPSSVSDPLIAAASCLVRLAHGAPPPEPASVRALLAHDPADPLLAAIALRVAEKTGDADSARRARAALTAAGGRAPSTVE
jgi:hypothetical protein